MSGFHLDHVSGTITYAAGVPWVRPLDLAAAAPENGQVLVYDAATASMEWRDQIVAVLDLDVAVVGTTDDGDMIVYDTAISAFVPRSVASEVAATPTGGLAATAVQPGDLATVATTGSYDDLSDKPTAFPPAGHTHTLSEITDAGTMAAATAADYTPTSGLAAVALSGAYSDLSGAPTALPPAAHTHVLADVTDAGTAAARDAPASGDAAAGEVVLGSDTRLTDARTPTAHTHTAGEVTGLAPVATSGAYSDLSGAPTSLPPDAHTHVLADVTDAGTMAAETAADYTPTSGLAAVALSGAYSDLSGAPTSLPPDAHTHVVADISDFPTLATVATTGAYSDLSGTPTSLPPEAHTHVVADITDFPVLSAVATSGAYGDLSGTPTSLPPDAHTHVVADISDFPTLSAVATSGAYGDLSGTPTSLPPDAHTHTLADITDAGTMAAAATADYTPTASLAAVALSGAYSDLSGTPTSLPPDAHTHVVADISDFPTLSTVATTGAYSDLSGTPTIPANANDLATEGSALGNITSTATVDCTAGQVFTATVTGAVTLTFSNPNAYDEIVLHLTNGGAHTVTWPASVDWPGGTAPTLTASGTDVLVFVTHDTGTTWRGALAMADAK